VRNLVGRGRALASIKQEKTKRKGDRILQPILEVEFISGGESGERGIEIKVSGNQEEQLNRKVRERAVSAVTHDISRENGPNK